MVLKRKYFSQVVVAHVCNLSIQEKRDRQNCGLEASLVYKLAVQRCYTEKPVWA